MAHFDGATDRRPNAFFLQKEPSQGSFLIKGFCLGAKPRLEIPRQRPKLTETSVMKICSILFCLTLPLLAQAKAPKAFEGYLTPDAAVKGEVVVVVPPDEIQLYIDKVQDAAKQDPEWFKTYSKDAKPGIPLPFDDKLGITKAEYQEYLGLWNKREMTAVPQGELILRLEKKGENNWMIRATGRGADITALRYDSEKDIFISTSGELTRITDVDADPQSILGAWKGKEWKMEKEDSFGITKENIAIGKLVDGSYGLLVYRLQEVTPAGTRLFDRSMVIRFAVKRS